MLIKVKVYPNSKKEEIIQKKEDSFDVYIKPKPQKGEANKEVVKMLASFFDVKDIKLIKGAKQRNKVFKINQIGRAVEVLKKGGIIAYPTDTVYGVGCNVFDEIAIKRLLMLKNRSRNPMSIAVSDIKMLKTVAIIKQEEVLKKLLPGPFTFILPKKKKVPDAVTAGLDTVGIRIPDNEIILEIIQKAGFPVITTSANLTGDKPAIYPGEVDLKVDFVVKGSCKYKKSSTVVDLVNKRIIRQGAGRIPKKYV